MACGGGSSSTPAPLLTAPGGPGHTPSAELALPLAAHPGDTWMEASLPAQTGVAYAWTAPATGTADILAFSAGITPGPLPVQARVTNTATSASVSGSRTVTVQTGTWLVEDGGLSAPMAAATETVLASGRVLVAGGMGPDGYPMALAEIYDPVTGHWNATGSLTVARDFHTATLLPDGTVLVAGGLDSTFSASRTAELYDPATGTWTATAPLGTGRQRFTATLLPDGTVLAAGGENDAATPTVLASAEIYTPGPSAGWSYTVQAGTSTQTLMTVGHEAHTATLLRNGTVLVAGGEDSTSVPLAASETYDPATGLWSATTTPLNTARSYATATLLADGTVLAAGGNGALDSAETYSAGTWTAVGSLRTGRLYHTAGLLQDGTVLVAGGMDGSGDALASAELYSPGGASWSVPSGARPQLTVGRFNHASAVLQDGTVLVAGGEAASVVLPNGAAEPSGYVAGGALAGTFVGAIASSERYTPAGTPGAGTWAGPVTTARQNHTATLLADGTLLVAGGQDATGTPLASVQLYNPATRAWTSGGRLASARCNHTATLLGDGTVLVAGGQGGTAGSPVTLQTAELYTPALVPGQAGAWTAAGTLAFPRQNHTATLLADGSTVLVAGGVNGAAVLASTELYVSGAWTSSGSMDLNAERQNHTATLLGDGTVLVAGGLDVVGSVPAVLTSSEIYTPGATPSVAGTWSLDGTAMNVGRQWHTATALQDGTVLVAGGADASLDAIAASEIYLPGTGWSATPASGITGRFFHTATLLADGTVLAAGGYSGGYLSSGEVYTATAPGVGSWALATGGFDGLAHGLNAERFAHTATLLGDGLSVLFCFGNGGDAVTETYVP
jgi:hypothetical protein